jgi:hypothetical protein|tara:strand:+ start:1344 stop:2015 length:672 start_codon:yes stop_codon:yes gene_type:complete
MAIQFNKLNGGAKKSNIKYMKLVDGANTFRILPDSIICMYTYWVKGAEGKDLPFEALQFDRNTEKFVNTRPCPISDMKLSDAKGEPLRCQWSYKCRVINAATGAVEILQLKKGILTDIISVAQQLEVDPTDLDTGMWLTVTRAKTGPLAYNVEYSLQQLKCKSSPLEDEHLAKLAELKSMEELFPVETYAALSARLTKHVNGEVDAEEGEGSASQDEAMNELS